MGQTGPQSKQQKMQKAINKKELDAINAIVASLDIDTGEELETIRIEDHVTYEGDPSVLYGISDGIKWLEKPHTLILYPNYHGSKGGMAYIYFGAMAMDDITSFEPIAGTYSTFNKEARSWPRGKWYDADYQSCFSKLVASSLQSG